MPMMICAADRVIETTRGHTFAFKANEPLHVPKTLVSFVMERGAFPAPGQTPEVTEATAPVLNRTQLEPTDPDVRQGLLVAAIKRLLDADKLVFTSGGKPNPVQLGKEAGLRIDAAERDQAWAAAQTTAEA
jgi:hypothetical protein